MAFPTFPHKTQNGSDRAPIQHLVGFGLAIFLIGYGPTALAQPGTEPLPVRVAGVRPQVIHVERSFVGTVTPIRQAVIGSAVEGRVQEVFVEQGDAIRPASATDPASGDQTDVGVPLIQLRTTTIDIELDAARSELDLRLAMQREQEESLPVDLQIAQATEGAAKARYQFALAQRDRGLGLAANGLSKSELDQIQSSYDAAHHELTAAQVSVQKLERTQQARLDQTAAQVNSQREALRLLEDRRSKYTVRAPFEGVVSRRTAEMGQWLSTGAEVAEVVQMNPIDVVIMVPQGMLAEFQYSLRDPAGDTAIAAETPSTSDKPRSLAATIRIDNQSQSMTGQVQALVPTAEIMSRSFPVKIRLDNPRTELGYRLNPGMLVKVQVTVGETQPSLMVHKDALVLNNTGKFLMVIDRSVEPNNVKSVPVKLGTAVADFVAVTGDLTQDDWVVIEGNERLRTGNPVKVINADSMVKTPSHPTTTTEIVGASK
ncbi:MAG: efflux RND transporter periplasmic adaptor subunit [Pirellulaceae bacterium]|nr:efflux RND transporter periplasmic adaptor subunit [Pirellulaceae bacterium]